MKRVQTPKVVPTGSPSATSPGRWWHRLVLAVVLVCTAAGTWALLEYVVWAKLPSALVGKWVVEGGTQDGATFDFYSNGTMVGRINVRGKEGIIDARVRLEGDRLFTTTRNPSTGRDETRIQTIRALTEWKLVIVDEKGGELRLSKAE